jgi:hypothetical protein
MDFTEEMTVHRWRRVYYRPVAAQPAVINTIQITKTLEERIVWWF